MSKMPILMLFAGLSGAAVAQNVPAPAMSGKSSVADPLNKIVCRTQEGTGSRLDKAKVCLTVREWKDLQDENQRALQDVQQRESGFDPPSG